MSNLESTPSLLGIPPEVREAIFEHVLPSGEALYKLPFEEHVGTNYTPLTSGISRRLQKVDISRLLTINKSIYFEILPLFTKINKFHINRFDQLRCAVYGSESGLSYQFRHLTVHGDTRLGVHLSRTHLINKISEWENLRYLSLAAVDFHDIFMTPPVARERPSLKPKNKPSRSKVTRRSDSSPRIDTDPAMCHLIDQLLSYNDGCLRIQGKHFFETFQVCGKKGRKTLLQVDTFIPELQKKCAAAAKSGKCFHEPVEEMIGDVKVSIGFSRVGITTAKIL